MTSHKLQIEYLPVEVLIPFATNAKLHSEGQVAQIAASIRAFEFNNPVLIDPDNGIIAGHGRVLAARKLGMTELPCIRLGHLTDAQKRAYILADNRLAETGGGWDEELLKAEIDYLAELGEVELTLTGFEASDIPGDDLESFGVESDEQRGQGMNYLSFGDKRVPLDEPELAGLLELLKKHVEHTGQPYGFVAHILRQCSR